jgi:hypothetical protein
VLDLLARAAAPGLPHLKDLDTLPGNAKTEVDLLTSLGWRTTTFNEAAQDPSYSRRLKFVKRHLADS